MRRVVFKIVRRAVCTCTIVLCRVLAGHKKAGLYGSLEESRMHLQGIVRNVVYVTKRRVVQRVVCTCIVCRVLCRVKWTCSSTQCLG